MNADNKIPEMNNYEEIAEFWDSHSLGDYWQQTENAEFEVDPLARQQYLVAVDPGLLKRVRQIAQTRGLATESLVNLFWNNICMKLKARLPDCLVSQISNTQPGKRVPLKTTSWIEKCVS